MEKYIIDIFKDHGIDISQYRIKEYHKVEEINGEAFDNYCAILYPLEDWPEDFKELLRYHPEMYILKYLKNYHTYKIYKVSGKKELIACV